jgi:DNA-binding NtrC family response regulator
VPVRAHDWPGKISEPGRVIERAVVLSEDRKIRLVDLPNELECIPPVPAPIPPAPAHSPSLARTKNQAERSRITDALVKNQDIRLRAALELGISRMSLYNKLRKYGMMGVSC